MKNNKPIRYRIFARKTMIPVFEIYAGAPESVVMESTGIKDKNGVEIFEDDIVMFETLEWPDLLTTVEWFWEWCKWTLRDLASDEYWERGYHDISWNVDINDFTNRKILVVGNIHGDTGQGAKELKKLIKSISKNDKLKNKFMSRWPW